MTPVKLPPPLSGKMRDSENEWPLSAVARQCTVKYKVSSPKKRFGGFVNTNFDVVTFDIVKVISLYNIGNIALLSV